MQMQRQRDGAVFSILRRKFWMVVWLKYQVSELIGGWGRGRTKVE